MDRFVAGARSLTPGRERALRPVSVLDVRRYVGSMEALPDITKLNFGVSFPAFALPVSSISASPHCLSVVTGSHCWRIRVNCALEPKHECCGVGSNQPPPKRPTRQAESSPAITPGQNTKPLPRPDAPQQPSTRPQVQPKPSPAESGVQTLPAAIPDREQPSTGPQVEPKPEGDQTLPAEIPPKQTKPFPRPQGQPRPQVQPKPKSGAQTLPAEIPGGVQALPGEIPEEGKPESGPQVQPKPQSGVQTLPAELPPKQTKPLPRPQTLPAELPQE